MAACCWHNIYAKNFSILLCASMPYYRIIIWTKDRRKPYSGIRFTELSNINSVFNMVRRKAEQIFRSKLLDVEVQMLPKMCTAVQKQMQLINSKSG